MTHQKEQKKEVTPIAQAMELWEVVLHRKWMVLFAGVLLSAAAIVFIALRPDYYTSSITVLVDPQKIPDRYVSDSVTMDQLNFYTLSQQIMSSTRLQQVIDEMQLYPELQKAMPHDEIVDYMRKNITIQEKQGGDRNLSAFTITFKGTNPQLVAQVATRLADSFIKWDLGARERQATETSRFLESQLDQAKKEMDEQDAKLSAFKTAHLGELPDQTGSIGSTLSRLEAKLQANSDTLNHLDEEKLLLLHSGKPDSSQAIVKSERQSEFQRLMEAKKKMEQHLADLRSRYSDQFPDVVQAQLELENLTKLLQEAPPDLPEVAAAGTANNPQTDEKMSAQMEVLSREVHQREEEQKQLLAAISENEAKADGVPSREQQLADLTRDSQSAKAHYQSLLDKTFAADIATDLERRHAAERFMILDPAQVPEKPIKRNGWRLMAMMIPCCFFFSAGGVVTIDKVKGTINTEHGLRRLLPNSIPIVGRIPLIETPNSTRRQLAWQAAAIAGTLVCCLMVAAFLWRVHSHI